MSLIRKTENIIFIYKQWNIVAKPLKKWTDAASEKRLDIFKLYVTRMRENDFETKEACLANVHYISSYAKNLDQGRNKENKF